MYKPQKIEVNFRPHIAKLLSLCYDRSRKHRSLFYPCFYITYTKKEDEQNETNDDEAYFAVSHADSAPYRMQYADSG